MRVFKQKEMPDITRVPSYFKGLLYTPIIYATLIIIATYISINWDSPTVYSDIYVYGLMFGGVGFVLTSIISRWLARKEHKQELDE